jgi:hypothetical protein
MQNAERLGDSSNILPEQRSWIGSIEAPQPVLLAGVCDKLCDRFTYAVENDAEILVIFNELDRLNENLSCFGIRHGTLNVANLMLPERPEVSVRGGLRLRPETKRSLESTGGIDDIDQS